MHLKKNVTLRSRLDPRTTGLYLLLSAIFLCLRIVPTESFWKLKAGFHIIVSVASMCLSLLKIWSDRDDPYVRDEHMETRLKIETILAYGSSEIDSSSISDDPNARIVSIARIASVVWEERFHIIVSVASRNLKRQRQSLRQRQLYGNQA